MSNFIFFKSKSNPPSDHWRRPLDLDISKCANTTSLTSNIKMTDSYEDNIPFNIYDLSYSYFGTIGMLTAIIAAAIAATVLNKAC